MKVNQNKPTLLSVTTPRQMSDTVIKKLTYNQVGNVSMAQL